MTGIDIPVLLLAMTGFFLGGAYVMWKTTRLFSVVLAAAGVLAVAGGIAWLV